MKKLRNQTDHIELQKKCDGLYLVLREYKEDLHLTNQDISDATEVPMDRARKYFAGDLKNPSLYDVMAFCMLFGLSLDTLLGNPYGQAQGQGNDAEVARLEKENSILQIKYENEQRFLQRVEKILQRTTIGLFVLLALCAVLVLTLATYFILDLKNHGVGFVKSEAVSPVAFIVAGVLVAAVIIMALLLVRVLKNKKHKGEENDG